MMVYSSIKNALKACCYTFKLRLRIRLHYDKNTELFQVRTFSNALRKTEPIHFYTCSKYVGLVGLGFVRFCCSELESRLR